MTDSMIFMSSLVYSEVIKAASRLVGGLSNTSKMPGLSYNLPAQACRNGARMALTPGTVCHSCYALRGRYGLDSVQAAMQRRLESLSLHGLWGAAMIALIQHHCTPDGFTLKPGLKGGPSKQRKVVPYFRWHDSGDLQSEEHLRMIMQVAAATPGVSHWLPTREYSLVNRVVGKGGEPIPRNLVIRVSGALTNGRPPRPIIPEGDGRPLPISTVHTGESPRGAALCPAPKQGGKCGDCRACWRDYVSHVSYKLH